MAQMLARNWWVGVGLGTAAGLGALALSGAGSDPASAQAGSVELSRQQLLINQRISQAAVRRGNEALELLDPVRRSGPADTAPGWGTGELRDSSVTAAKLANGAVSAAKLANGAVSAAKLANGAVSAAKLGPTARSRLPLFAVVLGDGSLSRGVGTLASVRTGEGAYKVTFNRDVSACGWTATVGAADTTLPSPAVATVALDGDTARRGLDVRVYGLVGTPADRPFHVHVACP